MSARVVVWFSCGAASAVAAKLTLAKYRGTDHEVVIVREVIGSEHEDNNRFAADCVRWFNAPITEIRSEKYRDHFEVIEDRRFISGPSGAPCTAELKKVPRFAFQRPDDIHVLGYTCDKRDADRAKRFREVNFELTVETPLITAGLTKSDCKAMILRAGIALPVMYDLGFENNNCIACSKAKGPRYWNRTRKYFPPEFWRMARIQRDIGYTQVVLHGEPIYLDDLPEDAGGDDPEPDIECSLLCAIAEQEIA